MRRDVQSGLLVLLGVVVARVALAGEHVRYVKAGMLPLLLGTAAVLVVVGAVGLLGTRPAPDHTAGHDHVPRTAWLLLVPVVLLAVVAPPALGSYSARRDPTALPPPPVGEVLGALPPPRDGAVELTLTDYAQRALYDEGRTLAGARVRLLGFVVPEGPPDAEGFRLTRMALSCCAADARAVSVEVTGGGRPAEGSWLSVEGYHEAAGGATLARLAAANVRPVTAPANPYTH